MKSIFKNLLPAALLFIFGCEAVSEPTVGSNRDTSIPHLAFNVDTTYIDAVAGKLISKGTVTNGGTATVASPWYIEAQFYSDSRKSLKLGGNYTSIGVPLSRGQSTFWTISYSSSNVDVRNYPDFSVSDLRGIYK